MRDWIWSAMFGLLLTIAIAAGAGALTFACVFAYQLIRVDGLRAAWTASVTQARKCFMYVVDLLSGNL